MTLENLNELQSDVNELELLLKQVSRSNVREILISNIKSLKSKIDLLGKDCKQNDTSKPSEDKKQPDEKPLFTKKITDYGWDESDKMVKLYLTIPKLESLKDNQISCDFTTTSLKFVAKNHDNKNHALHIVRLAYPINPEKSTCKVKSTYVLIMLKKETEGKKWGAVTDTSRKEKEAKDQRMDQQKQSTSDDPQAGIMNLMKNMYDEGDDDMKRMIKKTWYESQNKQKEGGGLGDMPSMPSF